MKIRNKLIHWLGGYTKAEYEMRNGVNVRFPVVNHDAPIVTLKAGCVIRPEVAEYAGDFVQHDLAYKIAEQMLSNNTITFTEEFEPQHVMSATARVVNGSL